MAASKLLLLLASFSLFFTISLSSTSQEYPHSIASAPSSSPIKSGYGGFNLQVFSSFFFRSLKSGSGVSRSLAIGNRMAAEMESNVTRGGLPPAPAPAPAAASAGTNHAADAGKKEKTKSVKWLLGMAVGLATGALSAIAASLLYRTLHAFVKRRWSKPDKAIIFQRKSIDPKAIAFIKSACATDSLELLGRGGSGEVYKSILENGKVIAIKKVFGIANLVNSAVDPKLESSYDLTKNSAQIKAELDTLGQIRHRNLVTLLAYIPLPNAHLLIYDYMENGSLHDVLNRVSQCNLELPWETRFNIAYGVAMGLKYLHCDGKETIVHCDLKAGNILLDKEMVPHIGDFGLAKIIPDSFTHFTSDNLAGTIGYIPPEYHQVCRYTTRGDVYGFGVVLVVLVTGKEPTHHNFSNVHTHLGNWLADVFATGHEGVMEIVDPQLYGHGDEAEIVLTLKLAAHCLNENPAHRPNSSDLLTMLGQIKGGHAKSSSMITIPIEAF